VGRRRVVVVCTGKRSVHRKEERRNQKLSKREVAEMNMVLDGIGMGWEVVSEGDGCQSREGEDAVEILLV
jgi:hypothetical protein